MFEIIEKKGAFHVVQPPGIIVAAFYFVAEGMRLHKESRERALRYARLFVDAVK